MGRFEEQNVMDVPMYSDNDLRRSHAEKDRIIKEQDEEIKKLKERLEFYWNQLDQEAAERISHFVNFDRSLTLVHVQSERYIIRRELERLRRRYNILDQEVLAVAWSDVMAVLRRREKLDVEAQQASDSGVATDGATDPGSVPPL